jgi:hypothetical protein
MYARIAKFQVGETDQVEETISAAREQVEETWSSPPEGLETAKDLYMLVDRENLTGLGITLFETEDDLRRGDEALNAMSPRSGGQRTDVSFYEVMLHKQR